MKLAAPLECHPWFSSRREEIVRWLDDPDSYSALRIPVAPVFRVDLFGDDPGREVSMTGSELVTLTKRKAWGPAPYVGEPFVYAWRVAVDQYGRQVAGQSRMVYTDKERPAW